MKHIIIIVILLVNILGLNAQTREPEEGGPWLELFLGFINVPENNSFQFMMEAEGAVWQCPDDLPYSGYFSLSSDPLIYNSEYLWNIEDDNDISNWLGWNIVYSKDQVRANPPTPPYYGYGLYKISTTASSASFYIDYRDDRLKPYPGGLVYGHGVDIWILYDHLLQQFFYYLGYPDVPYNAISNNSVLRFWDLKQMGDPTTMEFPSFWENSLILINNGNNHPRLLWATYPSEDIILNYKIYRKYGGSAWTYLASTTDLEYVDNSILINLPGNQFGVEVSYKITAVESTYGESPYSNSVSCNTPGQEIEKSNVGPEVKYFSNSLSQNYPNPFNPSTIIEYSIGLAGKVSIKIYDCLGNEMRTVVDKFQDAGTYSVNLNMSSFKSGVYYYSLLTDLFRETKCLLLIK